MALVIRVDTAARESEDIGFYAGDVVNVLINP
jgi:hypothetical protein